MKLKLAGLLSLLMFGAFTPVTAFAGEWKTEIISGEQRWWYEQDNGTYAEHGWFWLDGNQDGIAECYYFDRDGWMAADVTTTDGYQVNRDGAWTVQEVVQTRTAGTAGTVSTEGEGTMTAVTIQAGDRTFTVSLEDNGSVRALLAQLPMTITMSEMNGNEKYYYLPSSLPVNSRSVGTVHAGDLMLYGSDCLVLFYEDFRTSYRYTRLGSISDSAGLSEVLGSGSVQVTFRSGAQ